MASKLDLLAMLHIFDNTYFRALGRLALAVLFWHNRTPVSQKLYSHSMSALC